MSCARRLTSSIVCVRVDVESRVQFYSRSQPARGRRHRRDGSCGYWYCCACERQGTFSRRNAAHARRCHHVRQCGPVPLFLGGSSQTEGPLEEADVGMMREEGLMRLMLDDCRDNPAVSSPL